MIKVYRKTATIKAEQFDGSDEMVEKYNITPPMPLDPDYTINTLEGDMVLGVGDWIATGVNGEHWVIADDVFKQTYAELDERVEEKKHYVKVYDYVLGYLKINNFTGKMSVTDKYESNGYKTKFTDKDIEQLKQRDDVPLDWNKVRFVEAN